VKITVSTEQGSVPVSVVQLDGDVDASNYRELIDKVEELMKNGAKDFLVDPGSVPFMSSAGLVALHSLAIMLRGEHPVDPQSGWAALKSMDQSKSSGLQKHLKILRPQKYVAETLDKAGFGQFLETFTDLQTAVASFQT
jgi:anti-anti-sigma regulatory factor